MGIIVVNGKSEISQDKVDEVIEKIKEVLKEELPKEKQNGNIIEYIAQELIRQKDSWRLDNVR